MRGGGVGGGEGVKVCEGGEAVSEMCVVCEGVCERG